MKTQKELREHQLLRKKQKRINENNYKRFNLLFMKDRDGDIIDWVERQMESRGENASQFIRRVCLLEMRRSLDKKT